MSYFIDPEIMETNDKRVSIITDTFEIINSLPISKLSFFKSTELAKHFAFKKKTIEEVRELEKLDLLKFNEEGFSLTENGFLLSNYCISKLIL